MTSHRSSNIREAMNELATGSDLLTVNTHLRTSIAVDFSAASWTMLSTIGDSELSSVFKRS